MSCPQTKWLHFYCKQQFNSTVICAVIFQQLSLGLAVSLSVNVLGLAYLDIVGLKTVLLSHGWGTATDISALGTEWWLFISLNIVNCSCTECKVTSGLTNVHLLLPPSYPLSQLIDLECQYLLEMCGYSDKKKRPSDKICASSCLFCCIH